MNKIFQFSDSLCYSKMALQAVLCLFKCKTICKIVLRRISKAQINADKQFHNISIHYTIRYRGSRIRSLLHRGQRPGRVYLFRVSNS